MNRNQFMISFGVVFIAFIFSALTVNELYARPPFRCGNENSVKIYETAGLLASGNQPSPTEKGSPYPLRTIRVRHFRFSGNTVFSGKDLLQVPVPYPGDCTPGPSMLTGKEDKREAEQPEKTVADYENRSVSPDELFEITRAITCFLIDAGYVNSGAVLPDQEVRDGEVTIEIVEGTLTGIEVTGNSWLRDRYVSTRNEKSAKKYRPKKL